MVTTRSMSGTTKKPDTKIAAAKIAKSAAKIAKSGKPKKIANRPFTTNIWGVDEDAYCLYMRDRVRKYYEKNPPSHKQGMIPRELRSAIQQEWLNMSDMEKAPFIKSAEEMRANGRSTLDY